MSSKVGELSSIHSNTLLVHFFTTGDSWVEDLKFSMKFKWWPEKQI